MTTEIRSIFRRQQGAVNNLTDIFDIALVPRNTIGRMERLQIDAILLENQDANHHLDIYVIPWRVPATGLATLDVRPLIPIWAGSLGSSIVGTPNNETVIRPTINVVQDFTGIKRRGLDVKSKGTRSNNRAGWSMMVIDRDNESTAYSVQVTAEISMEWIGGSGSRKNLDIEYGDFDENENDD